MKNIKKHIRKISLLMGLSILFFSCSQYEDNNKNSTNSALFRGIGENYSGKEIFLGLFFFKNDIADGIPKLAEVKSNMMNSGNFDQINSSLDELSQISVEFISLNYPTFFDDLQTKMYSGNLYEITSALDLSAKLIEQAGLSSLKYQSTFLLGKKINNSEELKNQVSNLDLSTEEGVNKLNLIIQLANDDTGGTTVNNCTTFFAAAVAVFYAIAGAVSIAVAAYSVYYKVAYWGPRVKGGTTIHPLNIYTSTGGIEIEREMLISQIGNFFGV